MNLEALNKQIEEKLISVQKHATEDLYIYNYTQKAQFDRVWTEETTTCRGLIMDGKGNIVARPFKKFFNYEEVIAEGKELPNEPYEVFEKMDGSLGILYWIGDSPYIATRGSFTSDQAIKGTEILRTKYKHIPFERNFTYLFEIIYPENRIVVDYKGIEDLVLLSIVRTENGQEIPYNAMVMFYPDLTITKRIDHVYNLSELRTTVKKDNAEGFVIRFKNGMRVKMKYEEYVRLHRLVTGINARHVWENLKEGKGIQEMIDHVPDEFMKWVKDTADKLNAQYEQILQASNIVLASAQSFPTRKEQAELILKSQYPGVVFTLLDKKDPKEGIWKLIKPPHEVPFKKEI